MQTDERGRRVADGEDERPAEFGGVLHRHHGAGHAARLGLLGDLLVRHQAECFAAQFRERGLAHAGERHIGIRHDRRACRQRRLCLVDHIRREREVIRIVEIRRGMDNALDHLRDARRKCTVAQFGGDDLKRPLLDVLRLHVSVQNSIPSRAAMPFSYGCRRIVISVI